MRLFTIGGKVTSKKTKRAIKGLRVEIWDDDLIVDDPLGNDTTNDNGRYQIQFEDSDFNDNPFDKDPDIYFKIYQESEIIHTTKDAVLKNFNEPDYTKDFELDLPGEESSEPGGGGNGSKPVSVSGSRSDARNVLQATYTPRQPRPGEDPSRAPRALEKAALFASLAPSKGELRALETHYQKDLDRESSREALQAVTVVLDALTPAGEIDVLGKGKHFALIQADVLTRVALNLVQEREKKVVTPTQFKDTMNRQLQKSRALVLAFEDEMNVERVGYLHLERLSFMPAGIERGRLVYSLPLTPGEEVNIRHREWSQTTEEFERMVTDYMENFSEEGVAEKFELSESVNSQSQHSEAFNTGLTASGNYGKTSFSATAGYNASESSSRSEQLSLNQTSDITSKASSRARKEQKVSFRVASVSETEDETVQRIKNPYNDRATRVDYYQLLRKWQISLVRYGIRLTYDILIQEPGSGLLSKLIRIRQIQKEIEQDFDFDLKIEDISLDPADSDKYFEVVAGNENVPINFGVPALYWPKPFPIHKEWENAGVDKHYRDRFEIEEVPPDYVVYETNLNFYFLPIGKADGETWSKKFHIRVWDFSTTPSTNAQFYGEDELLYHRRCQKAGGIPEEDPVTNPYVRWNGKTGPFYLLCQTWRPVSFDANIMLTCKLKPSEETKWKQKIWRTIYEGRQMAFYEERRLMKEELVRLQAELGYQDALSLRKREREEVMKGVLNALGFPPESIQQDARKIRFVHHAIEWENMLYLLYPYFWVDPDTPLMQREGENNSNDDESYWDFKKYLSHPDPVHQAFLRAGCARVVLTIRPGFEDAFMTFVHTLDIDGILPAPFLEIGQEFRATAKANFPGIPPANPVSNVRPLLTPLQKKTWARMRLLIRLLEVFHDEHRRYPQTTEEKNENLITLQTVFPMRDPWGEDYVYRCPSPDLNRDFDLLSYGADKKSGGTKLNADIVSWNPAFLKDDPLQVQAWEDIETFCDLLEEYYAIHERYPTTQEGLVELKKLIPLNDTWGNEYHYSSPGLYGEYDLASYGRDNEPGGEGENADITSWAEGSLIGLWYEYTPTSGLDISFDEAMPAS